MKMAMYGANIAQLRELARLMLSGSIELKEVMARLNAQVDSAQSWQGIDADRFRQEWSNFSRSVLTRSIESLKDAADTLNRNADQQEEASADDLGGAPNATRDQGRGPNGDDRVPSPGARDDRQGDSSSETPEGGGTSYDGGLGPGVPGESVPTPEKPPWPPADEGAGEYNSESAGLGDHATKAAAAAAAGVMGIKWPDAAPNLQHFLGNSGEPLEQDVDKMLNDIPGLNEQVTQQQNQLGAEAVRQAQANGATGPITYPVSTPWTGYYVGSDENMNWFLATGGFQFSQQGQVTVYPPAQPGGEWTYVVDTQTSTYDRYNWDGGKSTNIGPLTVSDEQLAALHRAGLAQEYDLYGTSSGTRVTGSVK